MADAHDNDQDNGGHAGHDHTAGANARSLTIALGLTSGFLLVEVWGAWYFNSLALLSDAGHMLTDVAALGIALAAIRIGQRPADKRRTYGYRRFEVLAAAFNAVLLFVVAAFVLYEGVLRFFTPEPVGSVGMMVVAGVGLAVNLVAMRVLVGGKDASLNVKGAYLEVWADMLGSIGVIGGALVIYFSGWAWVDPLVAIAIGLWVLPRTWVLLRDTTHVLLQGVPSGIELDVVREAIDAVPGVTGTHDLHIWSLSGSDVSLTAHVTLAVDGEAEAVRKAITAMLGERFGIEHATIQPEAEPCDDTHDLHP